MKWALLLRTKTGYTQAAEQEEVPLREISAPVLVPERAKLGLQNSFVETTFERVYINHALKVAVYGEKS